MLCFHHITEIWGQLTANQFLIDVKKWVIQADFLDKVHTISRIIHTHNNSHLLSGNTSNTRGSPLFNRRENPTYQYLHSRYNPQQDLLNHCDQHQQGQFSYPVKPTNTFNTYQWNQGNPDRANSYVDLNFHRSQNQAGTSQQMHHNGGHIPNLSEESADAGHFNLRGRRSVIPLNRNTNEENLLYRNTIT